MKKTKKLREREREREREGEGTFFCEGKLCIDEKDNDKFIIRECE